MSRNEWLLWSYLFSSGEYQMKLSEINPTTFLSRSGVQSVLNSTMIRCMVTGKLPVNLWLKIKDDLCGCERMRCSQWDTHSSVNQITSQHSGEQCLVAFQSHCLGVWNSTSVVDRVVVDRAKLIPTVAVFDRHWNSLDVVVAWRFEIKGVIASFSGLKIYHKRFECGPTWLGGQQ